MNNFFLIASVMLNLIMITGATYIIYRKGGIRFIKKKLGIGQKNTDAGYGPYYDQRKSLFEVLPRSSGDILFLGHSLMDGCEWSEMFNDLNLKNRGINGELTEGIVKRLGPVINPPPRKIFVMTGANDVVSRIPMDVVLGHCRVIMESFRLNCPSAEIHFMNMLPPGRNYDKVAMVMIAEFNTGILKLTNEFGYNCIDVFGLMKDDEGYFDEVMSNDGSHLMGEGYLRLKERMREYLE